MTQPWTSTGRPSGVWMRSDAFSLQGWASKTSAACWISRSRSASMGALPWKSDTPGNMRPRARLATSMRPSAFKTMTPSPMDSRMAASCPRWLSMSRTWSSMFSAIWLMVSASPRNSPPGMGPSRRENSPRPMSRAMSENTDTDRMTRRESRKLASKETMRARLKMTRKLSRKAAERSWILDTGTATRRMPAGSPAEAGTRRAT